MNKRYASIESLLPLIEETLQDGRDFLLPVKGTSMWPFIKEGDLVRLQTPSAFKKGHIYLFRSRQRLFLHRLVARKSGTLILQGDANRQKERALPQDVVGEVKQLETTRGKELNPYSVHRKVLYVYWRMTGPLRPRIRHWCQRRGRK